MVVGERLFAVGAEAVFEQGVDVDRGADRMDGTDVCSRLSITADIGRGNVLHLCRDLSR
jgi:hypothetical protein